MLPDEGPVSRVAQMLVADGAPADRPVRGLASLSGADESELSFLSGARHRDAAGQTRAGAVVVSETLADAVPPTAARLVVRDPYAHFAAMEPESRFAFMRRDAQFYLPCLAEAQYRRSIYEVKTVLIKNEGDDGRPILYHRSPEASRVISVLGGKIDNIYDLFEAVKGSGGAFAAADPAHVFGRVHA